MVKALGAMMWRYGGSDYRFYHDDNSGGGGGGGGGGDGDDDDSIWTVVKAISAGVMSCQALIGSIYLFIIYFHVCI
jgi:hypothetical protein